MSRLTSAAGPLCALLSLAAMAAGQSPEPRGRSFAEGGGWTYAPREHHIIVQGSPFFGFLGSPVRVYGSYPVTYGGFGFPGAYWPRPLGLTEMPGSPAFPPEDALPAQISPWISVPPPKADPATRPVVRSSAAARLKALDYQADGDNHLRRQNFQRAYTSYRLAVKQADDLASAHLRYGIVFALLGRYDRAAMEFRRSTHIDPSLPTSGFTLESLFGPDSRLLRASSLSRIAEWANEDLTDPQRLYVLGVLLHYNQDERAQEFLSAAAQLSDTTDHIVAYLPKSELPANQAGGVPPAPRPAAEAVAPPPQPGLEDDPPPKERPKSPQGHPRVPPPKPNDSDGPLLLPPSPE